MSEVIVGALIAGAIQGSIAIDQHQQANQAHEESLKAAKVQQDAQDKLLADEVAKKDALKAGETTAMQLANQKKKQGMAAIGSRYSGGDGTATLLGGAGAPTSQGGKTLLGL